VGVLIEKSKAAGYVSKEPYPKGIEPKPEGEFPSTTLQLKQQRAYRAVMGQTTEGSRRAHGLGGLCLRLRGDLHSNRARQRRRLFKTNNFKTITITIIARHSTSLTIPVNVKQSIHLLNWAYDYDQKPSVLLQVLLLRPTQFTRLID